MTNPEQEKALMNQMYPKLHKGRKGQGFGDMTSMERGRAYGSTLSLNRQIGGTGQRRLT